MLILMINITVVCATSRSETVVPVFLSCLSIYLPIRLNPRRGHQTGSKEPSDGG